MYIKSFQKIQDIITDTEITPPSLQNSSTLNSNVQKRKRKSNHFKVTMQQKED